MALQHRRLVAFWNACLLAVTLGCTVDTEGPPPLERSPYQRTAPILDDAPPIDPSALDRFQPDRSHPAPVMAPSLIALGRMLWYEPRLSKDRDISCNHCHELTQFGVDHRPTSIGHRGRMGRRNAPTVYNAAGHIAQMWDGRSPNVEEQALLPILHEAEMGSSPRAALRTLNAIPEYQRRFAEAFPEADDATTFQNVGIALGAFVRGLNTRSRWDDFLDGDNEALTSWERIGLRNFIEVGCVSCHTGPQVGGAMFQRVGVLHPWPNQDDRGRMEVTGRSVDSMVFKVPTMKNVTQTGPWFHDGSAATLEAAVEMMGRHQLGLQLDDQQIASIVAWMNALSGEIPMEYIEIPALPIHSPVTTEPDLP